MPRLNAKSQYTRARQQAKKAKEDDFKRKEEALLALTRPIPLSNTTEQADSGDEECSQPPMTEEEYQKKYASTHKPLKLEVPTKRKGGKCSFFTWAQELSSITVEFPIESHVQEEHICLELDVNQVLSIKVNDTKLISAEFLRYIDEETLQWNIMTKQNEDTENTETLLILTVDKTDKRHFWATPFKGYPRINVELIEGYDEAYGINQQFNMSKML